MAIGTPTLLGSGTSTTNNTTCTATTSVAGTAGSLIIAVAVARVASQLTATFSGGGLTWTTALDAAGTAQGGCSIGFAQDPSGLANGSTITVTWSATATRKGLTLYNVTGLDTSAPHDSPVAAAANGTTGNASVTAAAATAIADELIVFFSRHNAASGSVTGTPSAGYTELDDFIVGTTTFVQQYSSYKIASATETPSPGATFSDTTTNWHAGVVAFKAAASGTAYTDSGTLTATFALSGSDLHEITDAGTLTATFALSGTDVHEITDAGTLTAAFALSGSDLYAHGYVDSGTLTATFVLGGTDDGVFHGYIDSGTLTAAYALSGTDLHEITDAGTLTAAFVLSGASLFAATDSGTLTATFTLSGTSVYTATDAGTLTITFVLTGLDEYVSSSAATAPRTHATQSSGPRGASRAVAVGRLGRTRTQPIRRSPTRVVTLGYSNQSGTTDIPTLEATLGRKFHGLRQNQQITTTSWSFAISDYDAGRGPVTYRSIQLSVGTYADISAGVWDANLTTIGQGLIDANRWTPGHAILTFMHEATLSSNDFLGTAQQYIDAFRYIRVLYDSMGVTTYDRFGHYQGGPALMARVAFEREFVNGTVNTPPAGKSYDDYDPDLGTSPAPDGTSYYELVGSDPYNDIVSGSLRYGTNAATLLDGPRNAAIARGKEWMIGELGCQDAATSQSHLDKAAWLDSVRVYLAGLGSRGPGVCRYMMTTQETGSLYNWDSSAEALAAGQRIAASSYFA